MALDVLCPEKMQCFQVADEAAGTPVHCPFCGQTHVGAATAMGAVAQQRRGAPRPAKQRAAFSSLALAVAIITGLGSGLMLGLSVAAIVDKPGDAIRALEADRDRSRQERGQLDEKLKLAEDALKLSDAMLSASLDREAKLARGVPAFGRLRRFAPMAKLSRGNVVVDDLAAKLEPVLLDRLKAAKLPWVETLDAAAPDEAVLLLEVSTLELGGKRAIEMRLYAMVRPGESVMIVGWETELFICDDGKTFEVLMRGVDDIAARFKEEWEAEVGKTALAKP